MLQLNLELSSLLIDNNNASAGGGLYSDLSSNLTLNGVSFLNNQALSGNGGAILLNQVLQLDLQPAQIKINLSTFFNNSAYISQDFSQQGGAIYFQSDFYPSNITIQNSLFQNNTADVGGGISLISPQFPSLQSNNFSQNNAILQGGAINCQIQGQISYFYREETIEQFFKNTMQYRSQNPFNFSRNTFYQNNADQIGGAIYLDYSQALKQLIGNLSSSEINITDSQNPKIYLKNSCISGNNFTNNTAQFGGAAIVINGYNASNISNNSEPGSCPHLQNIIQNTSNNNMFENNTSSEFLSYCPQTNITYPYINQSVILCICIYGQKLDRYPTNQAYYCINCQPNTFMNKSYDNYSIDTQCNECPEGFYCPGGFRALQLKRGYWSHTDLTVKGNLQANVSYLCNTNSSKSVSACLGYEKCFNNNKNTCSYDSVCDIAYTGPACSVCNEEQGYYPTDQQKCLQCQSNTMIALKMTGSVIIILGLLYISIDGTNGKIKSKLKIKTLQLGFDYIIINTNQLTALLRILTSYFQNISFLFQLQIQLPEQILQFFSFMKSLGQPLQPFSSSYQCLVQGMEISGMTKRQLFLLLQFIWSLILPTFIVIVVFLIQLIDIRNLYKKRNNYLQFAIIPIYLYLYLEFLPTLYSNSLSFLSCRTIAGREYLIGDSFYQCDNQENGLYGSSNLSIALPIFLFELLVPVTILIVIFIQKKRNLLYRPTQISTTKYQLGYFYLGYKEKCFYWEFVRIAQRILIMSVFLIFYDYDGQKSFFVVLIIQGYSLLSSYIQPNDNIIVQRTEFYSNQIQIFTFIAAGILQNLIYPWVLYVFMLTVALANIAFIVYTIVKMIPNAWAKLISRLAKYDCFKKYEFIQNSIEKNEKQRIVMNYWILVKLNIKKIIDINLKNFHIKYDQEQEQRKISEIEKVRNRLEQLKNRNIWEHNHFDVIIDEQEKLSQIDETDWNRNALNVQEGLLIN